MSDANRRPIAARRLQPVERAAGWLIQRRTSPNVISLMGMVAAMAAGVSGGSNARINGDVLGDDDLVTAMAVWSRDEVTWV